LSTPRSSIIGASPSPSAELAFEHLAVTRHEETEAEIDHRSENIGLSGSAAPVGVVQRRDDRVEKIKEPDNEDERGVFEHPNEGIDQWWDYHCQSLRQHDQPRALPIAESQCIGGLDLAFRDRLQAAAHDLGEIGRSEQDERGLGAQQLVYRDAGGQKQRQHHRSHEQHCNQRHAPDQLDVADAYHAHGRQP
jgi:hypothetical protein